MYLPNSVCGIDAKLRIPIAHAQERGHVVVLQRCESPKHYVDYSDWIANVFSECFAEFCWILVAAEFSESAEVPIWFCDGKADVLRHMIASCWSYVGKLLE